MEDHIIVTVDGIKKWELESDDDGMFLLSSLKELLGEDATTLSFINPVTGNYRMVKVRGLAFVPPKGGWGSQIYWLSKQPCVPNAPLEMCITNSPLEGATGT